MPVDRDADEYNMYHSRRGRAIIINNDIFDNNLVSPRKGSHVDVENLTNEFTNLGFEVTVFSNMPYYQISEAINEGSILFLSFFSAIYDDFSVGGVQTDFFCSFQ